MSVKEKSMDYYVDILIKPDSEVRLNVLLNTVYTKLHKILYDLGSKNIGISFPKYNVCLGNVLRLHGERSVLQKLLNLILINISNTTCSVGQVKPIPTDCKFRIISRKQSTMSQSKMRRLVKRGSITESEFRQYKIKMFSNGLDYPYAELVSNSNGKKYRRYIEFGELLDKPISGEFDQFGLSKTATVPWFD